MASVEQVARWTSRLSGPLIDRILKALSSSKKTHNFIKHLERKRIRSIQNLKRILIIPDINIGDAVLTQSFISPLKKAFPHLDLSYVYQHRAGPLVQANPHINHHFPLFKALGFPSEEDRRNLIKLIVQHDFDLIFNFSPYFSKNMFKHSSSKVIYPLRFIGNVIQAYASESQKAQIVFQMNRFANELLEEISPEIKFTPNPNFSGPFLYATEQLFQKTQRTLESLNIKPHTCKVFFNPDTSSSYTFIPFPFQLALLKGLLSQDNITLIMNRGFVFKDIEKKLIQALPSPLREKVMVIPGNTPIDVYAGLTDHWDVFISGDTAPLHLAAAKKIIVDSGQKFRNSTAVIGIFGATSGKIYGYDSFSSGYLPSSQDAPARAFEGSPSCKNLTCIDKIFKNCPEIRCFKGLKPAEVIDYIRGRFSFWEAETRTDGDVRD